MRAHFLTLAAAALAAGCSSAQELTGAAAARSRGAVLTEIPPDAVPVKSEDPLRDDARVLAKVNGKVIILRQVRQLMGPSYEHFLDQPEQLEKFLHARARDLAITQLILDEAGKLGFKATDEEMKRDLEKQEQEAAKKGTTLEQTLIDQGISRREWDDKRRESLCLSFANYYFSGYAPEKWYGIEMYRPPVDPYVGPDEIRQWARRHRESVMAVPESAAIRILDLRKDSFGGPGDGDATRWRLCGEALDASLARVQAGEAFAEVARAVSQGPEAADGGLLDGLTRTAPLRTEFLDWTFAESTKQGDVSPPLRIPTGFVVLQLERRTEARMRPIEEWLPGVRRLLEGAYQRLVLNEVMIRLLEEGTVSPPEFRASLLASLQEDARKARDELR